MGELIMTGAGVKAPQRLQLRQALLGFIKSNPQAEQLYQEAIAHGNLQLHVIDEVTPAPTPDDQTIVIRLSGALAAAEPAQLRQELQNDTSIFYPLIVELCHAANPHLHENGPRVIDFPNAHAWIEFGKRETMVSFDHAKEIIEHGVANCAWSPDNIPVYDRQVVMAIYQEQYQQAAHAYDTNLTTIINGVQAYHRATATINAAIDTLDNAATVHTQDQQARMTAYGRMQANPDKPNDDYLKEFQLKQNHLSEWQQHLQHQRSELEELQKGMQSMRQRSVAQLDSVTRTAATTLNQSTPSQRSAARKAATGLLDKMSAGTKQYQSYQDKYDAQLKMLTQAEREIVDFQQQLQAKHAEVLLYKLAIGSGKRKDYGQFFENKPESASESKPRVNADKTTDSVARAPKKPRT